MTPPQHTPYPNETERERQWLEIWQTLVECDVPHDVASAALQLLKDGGSVRDAFDMCSAAIPAIDVPLLLAAQEVVDNAVAESLAESLRLQPAYVIPPERAEGEE